MRPSPTSDPATTSARLEPLLLREKLARGAALLSQGQVAAAVEWGRSVADSFPGQARAYAFTAEACRIAGDLEEALAWIERAIRVDDDPQYAIKRGWLLSRLLRRDQIPPLLAQIAERAGNDALLRWQLGKLYYHHNLLKEAVTQFEHALALAGDQPAWRYDLAIARFYSGDFAKAGDDLEKLLVTSPEAGAVLYLRSTLGRQRPDANHVADLEARLGRGFRNPEDEAGALYALAKELEDLGQHDRSFVSLVDGARKKRSVVHYDPARFFATLEAIRKAQDAEAMATPLPGHEEEGAIFVVGMPRTGTTLTLRLLSQSGKVRDAGELTDFGFLIGEAVQRKQTEDPSLSVAEATMKLDFAALGRRYMLGARQMASGSALFVDKLPVNFMYCGIIHKALPKARIIHLVRDPLDSCYAIFKTLFFNAYDFSYDLDELADYYIVYRRMMSHWHEVMPGKILDVRYEDLVSDTETQARRLYQWCGLDWDAKALEVPGREVAFATASAAQVREPVHTRSVNSSRRHVAGLKPLVEKLAAAGLLEDPRA